jgi:SAM-dependent methyltransferase
MSLFSRLSYISRRRKLQLFYKLINPLQETRVLDIGAEINPDRTGDLQLIDSYPWKKNITAVNLSREHILKIKMYYPEIDGQVGNACNLPWPDKHFDVVYSNAVIEHVGEFDNQKKMAAEAVRVGKRWFVATPNRWYPFEFHLRLPLVTWLPRHGYLWAGRIVSYNHV